MYLVDTHVLLWAFEVDPRLSRRHADLLRQPESCLVSIASLWEVSIKVSLGKLKLRGSLRRNVEDTGLGLLGITEDHTDRIAHLPPHHRDPFDRMLVAQALCEGLVILSSDPSFRAYGVGLVA